MEAVVKENERLHSTIRALLERISAGSAEAGTGNVPTVSNFLNAMLLSASRNGNRENGGPRYDHVPDLLQFCSHLFMTAGPRSYGDMHINLKHIIPSESAIRRAVRKSADVPEHGQLRSQKLDEFVT